MLLGERLEFVGLVALGAIYLVALKALNYWMAGDKAFAVLFFVGVIYGAPLGLAIIVGLFIDWREKRQR